MIVRASLLLLPLFGTACALSCTEMGCLGGLTIELSEGLTDAGTYDLELTPIGENSIHVCSFSIDDAGAVTLDDCPGTFTIDTEGGAPVSSIFAGVSGDLDYDIALFHQRSVLFDDRVEPEWEPVYPNGRRCGAACTTGSIDLDVGPE